jgi:hypothetical protein
LDAARVSFSFFPLLVCHDKSIALNTHKRNIDKKKLKKLLLLTRIPTTISWVLMLTKTQTLELF